MNCTYDNLIKGVVELCIEMNPRPALPYEPYVQRIRQIDSASRHAGQGGRP